MLAAHVVEVNAIELHRRRRTWRNHPGDLLEWLPKPKGRASNDNPVDESQLTPEILAV